MTNKQRAVRRLRRAAERASRFEVFVATHLPLLAEILSTISFNR